MVVLKKPDVEAARILRSVWAELVGAIRIPVDPVVIARELGIDVFEAEMHPSISGAIRKMPNVDPAIILNRDDSDNRQRFTCAHEMGHYVLNSDRPEMFEYVDYRDEESSTGTHDEERFANQFAAALLMPADQVRKRYSAEASTVELAFHFRVSQEAMVNRLKNLGLKLV